MPWIACQFLQLVKLLRARNPGRHPSSMVTLEIQSNPHNQDESTYRGWVKTGYLQEILNEDWVRRTGPYDKTHCIKSYQAVSNGSDTSIRLLCCVGSVVQKGHGVLQRFAKQSLLTLCFQNGWGTSRHNDFSVFAAWIQRWLSDAKPIGIPYVI